MFIWLFLLFTILPASELYLLIKVGKQIGALNTIVLVIAIGAFGAYMARLQGFFVLQKMQENLSKGLLPSNELLDGVLIFLASVLLITPGFITDIFGIILLLPPTRSLIKLFLRKQMEQMMKNGHIVTYGHFKEPKKYNDIDI